MHFDYSDSERELRQELRRVLEKACPATRVRAVLDGDAAQARALTRELGEMGWLTAALPEAYGGQGLGYVALAAVAEELGRALAPTALGSSVFLAAEAILLGGSEAQKRRWLRELCEGRTFGALALVEREGPILQQGVASVQQANRLSGRKVAVVDGMDADIVIVAAHGENGFQLYLVELAQAGVTRVAQESMDPTRPLAAITFTDAVAEPLPGARGWAFLQHLLDRAAVLFAAEQLGGADAALALARNYALSRYAFGRPIGSFQAIKHKLADVYIANELARANVLHGAWSMDAGDPAFALAAATARVAACEAFERAARENMQTHGGISATWEHDCHLYYRRARHLAVCVGSVQQWRNREAMLLIAQHTVPEVAHG